MSIGNSLDQKMQRIIEEFECSICVNYMFPPIRMCLAGHSFCNRCDGQLTQCPICRGDKYGTRNYGMENIFNKLTVPCQYESSGCTTKMRGSSLKEHQKYCQYKTKICPFGRFHDCTWTGHAKDVIGHCTEQHSNNACGTNIMHLIYPNLQNGSILSSTVSDCYHMIFQTHGELFKCVWDINANTGLMRWCVIYMGPPANADRYYFEVVFQNVENPSEDKPVYGRSRCQEVRWTIFHQNRYILTHIDNLRSLSGQRGLHYTVSIYKFKQHQDLDALPKEPIFTNSSELLGSSFVVPQPSLSIDLNEASALHELSFLCLDEVSFMGVVE